MTRPMKIALLIIAVLGLAAAMTGDVPRTATAAIPLTGVTGDEFKPTGGPCAGQGQLDFNSNCTTVWAGH
jgi:hypothetical protein